MKRLYVSMISFVVSLAMAFSPVFAADTTDTKIANAITKLKSYYTTNNTLSSADDIIAVESLGMQAESDTFKLAKSLPSALSSTTSTYNDYTSDKADGTIGKQIIAIKLLGQDPTNYNGVNLVSKLEGDVNENGSFKNTYGVSADAWAVYALAQLKSEKTTTAANYLASEIASDGSYGYDDYNTKKYVGDLSTTSWAVEALSFADQTAYKTTIASALNFMNSKYDTGAYKTSTTGDPDTQACTLEGYFVADKINYMSGDYANDAIDNLLAYQDEKTGGFLYSGTVSQYSTDEAARCLGAYENGSVLGTVNNATDLGVSYKIVKPDDTKKDDKNIVTITNEDSTTKTNNATNKVTVKTKTGYSVKYKTKVSYTGKVVKPVTKVSFDGKALKLNKDYKITYSKNAKAIGKHTLTVKGLNEYKDLKVKKSFTVVPAKVANVKVTAKAKKLVVSYKKVKGSVKYQIKVTYKKAKTIKTKKTKVTVQSLKVKKTYKVKVRAYKKVGKKTYYGSWSKTKSVKTK